VEEDERVDDGERGAEDVREHHGGVQERRDRGEDGLEVLYTFHGICVEVL
jgi:hypothetical protein